MPIYEYQCRKCGSVSAYLERRNEWHLLKRKCRTCGSRRTRKVLSTFTSSVKRTRTETLNELKHMGPVRSVPRRPSPWGEGPHPSACPFDKPERRKGGRETDGGER